MFTLDLCPPGKTVWSPAAVSHSVHSEGCVKQKTWQSVFLDSQNKPQKQFRDVWSAFSNASLALLNGKQEVRPWYFPVPWPCF